MADQGVTINIRTRGGRAAARDADLVGAKLSAMGRSGRAAAAGLKGIRGASQSAARQFSGLTSQARYAGLALAGVGTLAVKSGLQFNASMEQNEVAFTQFLGSSKAARAELAYLYKTAASTPFEVPNITAAAKQLLAYGFSAKQANSYLSTIGDSIAGSGGGPEQIDSLVRAIGQIRGKGTLQAEELQQIGELGVLDRGKFAKNLGITSAELADAGNQGISANKALRALQKTLDDSFGGASAKQAKTFNGQLSTLRDNVNQTLGTLTRPLFDQLERKVLPALGDSTTRINAIFGRKDLDLATKLTMSRGVLRRKMGPIVNEAEAAIGRLHLGQKLSDAFEAAAPRLADAAGKVAYKAAGAFVHGFIHAGPYGKLFALGYLAKKLGAFSILGTMAAGRFSRGFARGGGGIAGAAGGAAGTAGRLSRAGRFLPYLGPVGAAAGAGAAIGAGVVHATGTEGALTAGHGRANRTRDRARGGRVSLADSPGAWRFAREHPNVHVYIDGKEVSGHIAARHGKTLAKGVDRTHADQKARG